MEVLDAEYRDGVLRPTRRLSLRSGERVGIMVVRRPDPSRWNLQRLATAPDADEKRLAEVGLSEWADEMDLEDRR